MSDLAWEFEEPEPVEASHLVMTRCCVCRTAPAAATPEHARDAMCIECGREKAGVIYPWFEPFGEWHPTVGYWTRPCEPPVVRAGLAEHPAPSVSSRDGVAAVYPSAVLKVAQRAREAGWEVRQQYSRGCGVHGSTGRPLAEADWYGLIFYGHPMTDARAHAVYSGGSWKSVNIAGKTLGGVTDLVYWLESGGRVEDQAHWFQHIRALADDAAWVKARAPKKPVRKKAKEHA